MKLIYSEQSNTDFPFWFDLGLESFEENHSEVLEISQWCEESFGKRGECWGYTETLSSNLAKLWWGYCSWYFKNKDHASLFKLRWGGSDGF